MITKVRRWKMVVVGTVGALVVSGLGASAIASATPGWGTERTPTASGVLDGRLKAKSDGVELKTRGDVKVDALVLTYHPGGFSGWHEHPGIVIATVIKGSVARKLGCGRAETFTEGQSFTEVGRHYVSNPSAKEDAVLSITQIYPADFVGVPRIDLPAPICRS